MIALVIGALALAGVPDSVRPVLAPIDAPIQYADWLTQRGQPPTELVCDEMWPGEALLCFVVVESETRRWVTAGDLVQWKVDAAGLRATISDRALPALATQPTRRAVDDMAAHYWVADDADGWEVASVLHPAVLTARLGGESVFVSVPVQGVLLAWTPGNPELDKVLAVAARRMYDEQPNSVTAVVYQWNGAQWTAFGEAVPSE